MKRFTLDELRTKRAAAVRAARSKRGCLVVDENGQKLFSLWIPSTPLEDEA